ncbi:bombyxin A-2 homolog [Homalodisca vitripennis]|uniref:bombyxin A-2 homolog n=1 Tax=Homalodisca vitripennis TaxID=197043 RepID=UPI001EEBF568|nr:bombyxin A-2 homolog [Homalodisca vitripennis]
MCPDVVDNSIDKCTASRHGCLLDMWRTAVVVCLLLAVCVEGAQNWLQKRSRLQVCGEQLTQSLMVICDNKYNKRNQLTSDLYPESSPWWSRSRAVSLMTRVRRGVVDECCDKPCSLRELSSYCLDPDRNQH